MRSDLDGKPLTSALLRKAARDCPRAGATASSLTRGSLVDAARLAIASAASSVTADAMRRLGLPAVVPRLPVPKPVSVVAAFGVAVAFAMTLDVRGEDVDLDARSAVSGFLGAFFGAFPDDARPLLYRDALTIFQQLAGGDVPEARRWMENLGKLTTLYLMRVADPSETRHDMDLDAVYGDMLGALLEALR